MPEMGKFAHHPDFQIWIRSQQGWDDTHSLMLFSPNMELESTCLKAEGTSCPLEPAEKAVRVGIPTESLAGAPGFQCHPCPLHGTGCAATEQPPGLLWEWLQLLLIS